MVEATREPSVGVSLPLTRKVTEAAGLAVVVAKSLLAVGACSSITLPENSDVALLSVAVAVSRVPLRNSACWAAVSGIVKLKPLALVSVPWLKPLMGPE